jgi:hypothetical protein
LSFVLNTNRSCSPRIHHRHKIPLRMHHRASLPSFFPSGRRAASAPSLDRIAANSVVPTAGPLLLQPARSFSPPKIVELQQDCRAVTAPSNWIGSNLFPIGSDQFFSISSDKAQLRLLHRLGSTISQLSSVHSRLSSVLSSRLDLILNRRLGSTTAPGRSVLVKKKRRGLLF